MQRVGHWDAHIVDGWFGGFVEGFVSADGVGELDGREGREVPADVILQVRDEACISTDDLGGSVSCLLGLCRGPDSSYLLEELVTAKLALLLVLLQIHQLNVLPHAHDSLRARGHGLIHHIG